MGRKLTLPLPTMTLYSGPGQTFAARGGEGGARRPPLDPRAANVCDGDYSQEYFDDYSILLFSSPSAIMLLIFYNYAFFPAIMLMHAQQIESVTTLMIHK